MALTRFICVSGLVSWQVMAGRRRGGRLALLRATYLLMLLLLNCKRSVWDIHTLLWFGKFVEEVTWEDPLRFVRKAVWGRSFLG